MTSNWVHTVQHKHSCCLQHIISLHCQQWLITLEWNTPCVSCDAAAFNRTETPRKPFHWHEPQAGRRSESSSDQQLPLSEFSYRREKVLHPADAPPECEFGYKQHSDKLQWSSRRRETSHDSLFCVFSFTQRQNDFQIRGGSLLSGVSGRLQSSCCSVLQPQLL